MKFWLLEIINVMEKKTRKDHNAKIMGIGLMSIDLFITIYLLILIYFNI